MCIIRTLKFFLFDRLSQLEVYDIIAENVTCLYTFNSKFLEAMN